MEQVIESKKKMLIWNVELPNIDNINIGEQFKVIITVLNFDRDSGWKDIKVDCEMLFSDNYKILEPSKWDKIGPPIFTKQFEFIFIKKDDNIGLETKLYVPRTLLGLDLKIGSYVVDKLVDKTITNHTGNKE